MKETLKYHLIPAIIIMLMAGSTALGVAMGKQDAKYNVDKSRNIEYENYVDSIWYTDRDYFLDVIVETDEFQEYLEEHPEWGYN